MADQEMVITQGKTVAVRGGQPDGIDMHPGDILPAFIKVVQGTSEHGTPGKIRRADTEEEYDELNLIPIRIQKNRTYWGPGDFDRNRTPACFSNDGDFGAMVNNDGLPTTYPGQACSSCPQYTEPSQWDRDKCQSGYMILFFNVDTFEVMGMRLTGTSAKLSRKFKAASVYRKTIMKLSTERKTNAHGSWYALVAEPGRIAGKDELEIMTAEAAMHSSPQAITNATVVDNSSKGAGDSAQEEQNWREMQQGSKERLDTENAEQAEMKLEEEAAEVANEGDQLPPW